jgi:hypothetical protein
MMVKLMVLIVIAVGVGLFLVKGPNGKPFLSVDGFTAELPDSDTDILPEGLKAEEAATITKVYKWKDKDGVWQFSDSPEDKQGAEIIEIDSNVNTIQAFTPSPTSTGIASSEETVKPASIPGVMTVSPEQAAEMMETVKGLQKTMDQRQADLEAISGINN